MISKLDVTLTFIYDQLVHHSVLYSVMHHELYQYFVYLHLNS